MKCCPLLRDNSLLIGVKHLCFVALHYFSNKLYVRKRNCIFEIHYEVPRKFDSRMLQLFLIVVSSQSTAQRCIVYSCNVKPVFVYALCQPLNMLRCILNDAVLNGIMFFLLHTVCRTYSGKTYLWFLTVGHVEGRQVIC